MEERTYPAIAIVGPSAVGKGTIVAYLQQFIPTQLKIPVEFSVSATTRNPGSNEKHGIDYFFHTAQEFESLVVEEKFVEYATTNSGSRYGTLKSEVEDKRFKGVLIFDTDYQGGYELKRYFGDSILVVFVSVPFDLMKERIRLRGRDTEEQIKVRLANAPIELAHKDNFDAYIENINLDETKQKIQGLVSKFLNKHAVLF